MAIKSMVNLCLSFAIVVFILAATNVAAAGTPAKPVTILPPAAYLSFDYYHKTCPSLEAIIQSKTRAWVAKDPTLAPSLIRLHFHDCAIRGCDASILINNRNSERASKESATLRGFQIIDDIKAEVERRCPKTVSCADILTTAARDATILVGGPFWEVPFGRKDGKVSLAKEADLVPNGHEDVTKLIGFFEKMGLNTLDLVILSGAHTIGRSTCGSVKHRFNGTGKFIDRTIDLKYASSLKRKCARSDLDFVDFDVTTPRTFDTKFYTNLAKKLGLLSTDQLLYSDARTFPYVSALASPMQSSLFFNQFAVSMVKLGNVGVLTKYNGGEIRRNCNYVNV